MFKINFEVLMLEFLKFFYKKKPIHVNDLLTVKEIEPNQFWVEAKNGLSASVDFHDNYMFVNIKDRSNSTVVNYCTERLNTEQSVISFVSDTLSENIFFQFDKKNFSYLKNRYTAVFTNHPNVLNMLLSPTSFENTHNPSTHYFNDIYYAEVIVVQKEIVKNIKKVSFHLLSSHKKAVQKAHFYIVDNQLFEIGRFSDFSSISIVKTKLLEFSNTIDIKRVRILKHDYNACLIIKEGRKISLIVEDFKDLDANNNDKDKEKNNKFLKLTYENGLIQQESKTYTQVDYDNYYHQFINVYSQRLNYFRSHYPSLKALAALKELELNHEIPLSSEILNVLSMYEI